MISKRGCKLLFIGILIGLGAFTAFSLISAVTARQSMEENEIYEQSWQYIVNHDLLPEHPAYTNIMNGHAAYQASLAAYDTWMVITMVGAVLLSFTASILIFGKKGERGKR